MKSFLVATDFSAPSKTAAMYAAQLARAVGAEITLMHAYLLPTPVSEVPYVMVSVEELQKDNEKMTAEMAEHLRRETGVTVKTMVNIGLPADEVSYQAREVKADIIVVGMRGASNALDKLIGSTTSAILRKSHIPVLVVPENSLFSPLRQLTYATDFSYTMSLRCLSILRAFMHNTPEAKLQVLNIQRTGEIMTAEQVAGKVRLEPMLEGMSHEYHTLEHATVEGGIEKFLENHQSQMLVMVAHKHNWWERLFSGSHTQEMAYRTGIPLLVLEDKD